MNTENTNTGNTSAYILNEIVWADALADPYYYPAEIVEIVQRRNSYVYIVKFFSDDKLQFLRSNELQKIDLHAFITCLDQDESYKVTRVDEGKKTITMSNGTPEEITIPFDEFRTDYFPSTHHNTVFSESIRVEDSLNDNIFSHAKIQKVQVKGGEFFDSIDWNLHEHINIVLGENGHGKTYLLRTLIALLQNEGEMLNKLWKHNIDKKLTMQVTLEGKSNPIEIVTRKETIKRENSDMYYLNISGNNKTPLLAIPSVRHLPKTKNGFVTPETYDFVKDGGKPILSQDLNDFVDMLRSIIFEWGLVYSENKSSFKKENGEKLEQFSIVEAVFKELVKKEGNETEANEGFSFLSVERNSTAGIMIEATMFGDKGSTNLENISQGTLSILSIVSFIYTFLSAIHKKRKEKNVLQHDEVSKQQAIVIIDEIDAHLHPKWQRKIVNILHKTFPHVQFILTAHSPFVVQDRKKEEVYHFEAVDKENEKRYKIVESENDFYGADLYDVLERAFGYKNQKLGEESEFVLKEFGIVEKVQALIKQINDLNEKYKTGKANSKDVKELNEKEETLKIIHEIHKKIWEQASKI